ncbi:proteasome assembly chaperone family protein [Candidatus Bathyarchaeota archaeon]|nr:MAG: proteasome assembly chaperone family protein [Candidatus Bathyarchaeota archaeon]
MKKTTIIEKDSIQLENPVLIEGLPGLGMVGRIAVRYLIKKLKAKPFAHLYSPHFPYYVIVNKRGNVRLLRGTFYYWRNPENRDLIFFTGDSQAQTIEGQYEIATKITDYAKRKGVNLIVTLGGYRKEVEGTPRVYVASTSEKLLEKALKSECIRSPSGNPIVGIAGILLGIARFKGIKALCLLGETRGYMPDPKAAKSVLNALCKILELKVDLSGLDAEIERAEKLLEKMHEIEAKRESYVRQLREEERERTSYIS